MKTGPKPKPPAERRVMAPWRISQGTVDKLRSLGVSAQEIEAVLVASYIEGLPALFGDLWTDEMILVPAWVPEEHREQLLEFAAYLRSKK